MEGRRVRRFGRRRQSNQTLLPFRVTYLSNTVSCWYCDVKSSSFNEPLFRLGRRHSRCLRIWFSVGIVFSLSALLGVTMILLWEFGRILHLYSWDAEITTTLGGSLFGVSISISDLNISLPDIGYTCISTILSVALHELGHALAAASEGVQIEYIAIFLAVLFPGALVAFNDELLQALPRVASLRIYTSGIWHNAAFGAVCALALYLLPVILYPFYVHGDSPMVLEVSSMSPLSNYLSTHDSIVSLDGARIHTVQDWREMIALLNEQALHVSDNFNHSNRFMVASGGKGYCVPYSLLEENIHLQLHDNQTSCPDELTAFATVPCGGSIVLKDGSSTNSYQEESRNIHCLNAKNVVKLTKCGNGWANALGDRSTCPCTEEESCLAPLLMPGVAWVEITYMTSASPECQQQDADMMLQDKNYDLSESSCVQTFVFIGDTDSMEQSLSLTSYRPRWSPNVGACLPSTLEKLLACIFRVSVALAFLNSLPVYLLDGESILEMTLQYLSFLSPRKRVAVLRCCKLGGTLITVVVSLQIFLVTWWS